MLVDTELSSDLGEEHEEAEEGELRAWVLRCEKIFVSFRLGFTVSNKWANNDETALTRCGSSRIVFRILFYQRVKLHSTCLSNFVDARFRRNRWGSHSPARGNLWLCARARLAGTTKLCARSRGGRPTRQFTLPKGRDSVASSADFRWQRRFRTSWQISRWLRPWPAQPLFCGCRRIPYQIRAF